MADTKAAADAAKTQIVKDIPVIDPAAKADKAKKAATGPKPIKTKTVKRRFARMAKETDAKKLRKKTNKLGMAVLRQIASGDIKSPKAVAKAYFAGVEKQKANAKPAEAKAEDKAGAKTPA